MKPLDHRSPGNRPNCNVPGAIQRRGRVKRTRKRQGTTLHPCVRPFNSLPPVPRTPWNHLFPVWPGTVHISCRVARSSRGCNIISSESRVKGCYYAYPMAGRSSYVSRAFRSQQKRSSIAFLDKSWLADPPQANCPPPRHRDFANLCALHIRIVADRCSKISLRFGRCFYRERYLSDRIFRDECGIIKGRIVSHSFHSA